ncbi:diadenylate cyclase [Bacillus cereus]|uniref:diadenylate cyclase n=1 Tax=Bacillus cereus TaxID=1396 RepID=UPI0025A2253A|nr:diadenylate cyclase [Bacillus cereus]MDM5461161.1 diadenylate cyclase [Bacillus cereus]
MRKVEQFYKYYQEAVSRFIGLEVSIDYNETQKISIRFKDIPNEILETNKSKFEQISQIIEETLLNFYERYNKQPYQPIYKQLLIEELAYQFIGLQDNKSVTRNLMEFVEKLKDLCNETYELESTKMGFIIVKDSKINEKEVLKQYNINYYSLAQNQSLDYFINEKQTLKLIDSKSISLVLNLDYEVIGIAQKKKGYPSIKDIMLNRYRDQEERDIKDFTYEYYIKSQFNFGNEREIEKREEASNRLLLRIKNEFNVEIEEEISCNIIDLIDGIDMKKLSLKEKVNLREYLLLYTSLQDELIQLFNQSKEKYTTVNAFLEEIQQEKNGNSKAFDFVYFDNKQIFWSSSYENIIIYSNGRWKLRNYFLLRNIISRYVMQQYEIEKQVTLNLNYTLEIINDSISKIFDLYTSIKSLSDKNIGSLIVILKRNDISEDDVYSGLLVKGGLSFNKYNMIIRDERDIPINIVNCDNYLFELVCSVDGAVILDYDLNINSVGEMIRTVGLKSEKNYRGSRTLAALSASKFGLAIKISEDGDILIFEEGHEIARI